jgi:hypothetical protein
MSSSSLDGLSKAFILNKSSNELKGIIFSYGQLGELGNEAKLHISTIFFFLIGTSSEFSFEKIIQEKEKCWELQLCTWACTFK